MRTAGRIQAVVVRGGVGGRSSRRRLGSYREGREMGEIEVRER